MFQISISQKAEDDLKNSCVWYELQQTGLSKRFLKDFFRTVDFIQVNPFLYQAKHKKNYRSAKLNKFPFLILYTITEKEILINAVFHTSRNPKKKYRK